MPFRGQRDWQQRKRRSYGEKWPFAVALPPSVVDFGENWKNLCTANGHEWNYRSPLPQCHPDEIIATEPTQLVRITIQCERTLDTFWINSQQFIVLQDRVCIVLAGHDSTELGHEVREE